MPRRERQDFGTDRVAKPKPETAPATQMSPALAALVLVVDGVDAAVHPLLGDHFVIGRGSECEIRVIGDAAISRRHALITRHGVSFMIEDNSSSNGVYMNGERITAAHELKVGDVIQIGEQMFIFKRRV